MTVPTNYNFYSLFCYAQRIKLRFYHCCHAKWEGEWVKQKQNEKFKHILTFIFKNNTVFSAHINASESQCIAIALYFYTLNFIHTQCSVAQRLSAWCVLPFPLPLSYIYRMWTRQMNAMVKCQRHQWCW